MSLLLAEPIKNSCEIKIWRNKIKSNLFLFLCASSGFACLQGAACRGLAPSPSDHSCWWERAVQVPQPRTVRRSAAPDAQSKMAAAGGVQTRSAQTRSAEPCDLEREHSCACARPGKTLPPPRPTEETLQGRPAPSLWEVGGERVRWSGSSHLFILGSKNKAFLCF